MKVTKRMVTILMCLALVFSLVSINGNRAEGKATKKVEGTRRIAF